LLSRNIIPLLALASLVAAPARGFAEELRQVFQQDLSDFSDTTLTPQQWRQRVEDARRQSEAFVAQARSHTIDSIQSDQENVELTDQLAMNDPSLKPGDIVSTSHGLLVFIGRDGAERRPNDFERIPQAQVQRSRGMVR
jgi:cell shape-determining protein MreC